MYFLKLSRYRNFNFQENWQFVKPNSVSHKIVITSKLDRVNIKKKKNIIVNTFIVLLYC